MSKAKKINLPDGTSVWEIRTREGGRGSGALKRRFPSAKEAYDFQTEFLKERQKRLQGYVEVGSFHGTSFRQEADNWLKQLKLRCSPGHYRRSKDTIEDFNKTYGNYEPNKITLDLLCYLQGKLKERPGRKAGTVWANASVNRYTEAICAVLNFSAEQRRIPHSPITGFKKLPKNSPEMLFWSEEEACSFLAWASHKYCDWSNKSRFKSRKNYIAYFTAINTGARAGEIWGLRPSDLFFNADELGSTIFIRRQFNLLKKDYGPLKGELLTDSDKSRHVPCPPELREELKTLIRHNDTRRDEPLFQSTFGTPINHDSFADRFERDVRQWIGRRIRFHDLRHTAATLMLSKGVDVKTVSDILGHEDLQTTMIYAHLLGNRIKQVSITFSVLPAQLPRPQLQLVGGGRNPNVG
jgi:integrase